MQATLITLSTAFLLAGPQPGSVDGGSAASYPVREGLVKLIYDREVPAREAGVLEKLGSPLVDSQGNPVLDGQGNPKYLAVREGTAVAQGQVIARIDDEMEKRQKKAAKARLSVAELQAENTVRVDYATAAAEVATAERVQAEKANATHPGTVPSMELSRLRLAEKQAKLSIVQSQNDLEIDQVSVGVREAEDEIAALKIDHRQIVAPIDGVVMKCYVDEKEWVQPGDPVVRIIRIDRLRIEGRVDASEISPARVKAGQRVTLRLDTLRLGSRQSVPFDAGALDREIEGEVVFVSPEIDGDSTFEVWAEVDNVRIPSDPSRPQEGAWVLLPGMWIDMTIHFNQVARRGEAAPLVGSH